MTTITAQNMGIYLKVKVHGEAHGESAIGYRLRSDKDIPDQVLDILAERINKYDEAVRLLERVKLENDDNCIHSDLAVDIDAFLAPKEAEDE